MENLQEKPDLLAGLEPDGWRNPASTNADYAFDFIRSASYCDPLYCRPKVESLLEAQRAVYEARMAECRKEALLEAAEIAGKAYTTFKATEQAHYRLSAEPFIHENFGFNISVVRYSQYVEDELRRMAEGEKE